MTNCLRGVIQQTQSSLTLRKYGPKYTTCINCHIIYKSMLHCGIILPSLLVRHLSIGGSGILVVYILLEICMKMANSCLMKS